MTNLAEQPKIQLGDYIIIQRQKYTKLQKFGKIEAIVALGNDQLELRGLLDQPYGATFKMCTKETSKQETQVHKKGKQRRFGPSQQRLHTLEICSETEMKDIRQKLGISTSGEDNRHILDNGESQTLDAEQIKQLREELSESTKIIEKIVENSKTFHSKTEYSQEKYLKKKEKKYFEFVQIRRPTLRLLTEIFYRLDPDKVLGMRIDTLSQLISYADVSAHGKFLLYESGTNGLLPAAFLNSIGAGTTAELLHLYPGMAAQRQAILALNLAEEHMQRCISANIFGVLREFYKEKQVENVVNEKSELESSSSVSETKKECSESTPEAEKSLCEVKADTSEELIETVKALEQHNKEVVNDNKKAEVTAAEEVEEETTEPCQKKAKLNELETTGTDCRETLSSEKKLTVQQQKCNEDNARACNFLRDKVDSLVIAAKEHPLTIVKALLPFVKPSRPVVIFSQCREVLMELYVELKTNSNITNLHLTSNWLRMYQILPNRTHPEVMMNGNSGYLLTGYTFSK